MVSCGPPMVLASWSGDPAAVGSRSHSAPIRCGSPSAQAGRLTSARRLATSISTAGSNDLIFSAEIEVPGGASTRLFRLNTALPPPRLTSAGALPAAGPGDSWNPRPSPDGHQIAFLAGSPASAQVWLMNADGTGLARLTRFDAEAFPFSCREVHWGEP